jgi:hypothetical protein
MEKVSVETFVGQFEDDCERLFTFKVFTGSPSSDWWQSITVGSALQVAQATSIQAGCRN